MFNLKLTPAQAVACGFDDPHYTGDLADLADATYRSPRPMSVEEFFDFAEFTRDLVADDPAGKRAINSLKKKVSKALADNGYPRAADAVLGNGYMPLPME